jgi:hypothetical protein
MVQPYEADRLPGPLFAARSRIGRPLRQRQASADEDHGRRRLGRLSPGVSSDRRAESKGKRLIEGGATPS